MMEIAIKWPLNFVQQGCRLQATLAKQVTHCRTKERVRERPFGSSTCPGLELKPILLPEEAPKQNKNF